MRQKDNFSQFWKSSALRPTFEVWFVAVLKFWYEKYSIEVSHKIRQTVLNVYHFFVIIISYKSRFLTSTKNDLELRGVKLVRRVVTLYLPFKKNQSQPLKM